VATVPLVAEPALWGLRRRLLDAGDRLHLARPAVRAYELALAAKSDLFERRCPEADGLPLPPALLRAQAGPRHADAAYFLQSGRQHADLIRELLAEAGSPIETLQATLDWGCGCGRILRQWQSLEETRVLGCDMNPKMVDWCSDNLPFAEVTRNELAPPFPYPDSSVTLVYALSVITHLPEDLQHAWIADCFRVLEPEGYLLFSTLGEHYLSLKRLTEDERRAFSNGELIVLYEDSPGTSLCSAYHPAAYVRERLAADFDAVSFRSAAEHGRHDIYVFQKPA
jgi:SAM-dependent methyltransferase